VVPPSSTALQFLKLRETARVRSLWSASCYPVRGAKFWKSTAFGSSSHCLWRYRIFACRAANRVEGSQPAIKRVPQLVPRDISVEAEHYPIPAPENLRRHCSTIADTQRCQNHGPVRLLVPLLELTRYNAWAAIRKRAKAAGLLTPVGCHTWRATGITICRT